MEPRWRPPSPPHPSDIGLSSEQCRPAALLVVTTPGSSGPAVIARGGMLRPPKLAHGRSCLFHPTRRRRWSSRASITSDAKLCEQARAAVRSCAVEEATRCRSACRLLLPAPHIHTYRSRSWTCDPASLGAWLARARSWCVKIQGMLSIKKYARDGTRTHNLQGPRRLRQQA